MKITDILRPECVCVPLNSTDKFGAIEELVGALDKAGELAKTSAVLEAVVAREKLRSTCTEYGLAVPHGKSAGVKRLVMSVGKPSTPIDFGGPSGHPPCGFIVLLASPVDETGPHIQALARISRLWLNPEFRKFILGASDPDAVYNAFAEREV